MIYLFSRTQSGKKSVFPSHIQDTPRKEGCVDMYVRAELGCQCDSLFLGANIQSS